MDKNREVAEILKKRGYTSAAIQTGLLDISQDDINNLIKKEAKKKEDLPKNAPDELYMSWDELDQKDLLSKLKQNNYTLFCVKYFQKYNKSPQNYDSSKVDFSLKTMYENAILDNEWNELVKLSWKELEAKNLTQRLRDIAPEVYRAMFYQQFGKYPQF